MVNTIKKYFVFLIIALYISYCILWFKIFVVCQYYVHASFFMSVLYGTSPIIIGYLMFQLMKYILNQNK